MKEKVAAVKAHIRENKKVYITGATCLVVGAFGGAAIAKHSEIAEIMLKAKQINILSPGSRLNNVQIAFQERSTPSKPIFDKKNNIGYGSISEAVRRTGRTRSSIAADPDFELLNVASR